MTWEEFCARPYTGCTLPPCQRIADLLFNGYPLCFDCCEVVIERIELRATAPAYERTMPALSDRVFT